MDQAQYQQLLNNSPNFQELELPEKERILNLTGEDRNYYITIFQDEKSLLESAAKQFEEDVDHVVAEYKFSTQQAKKTQLKSAEKAEAANDEVSAEKLLNNL